MQSLHHRPRSRLKEPESTAPLAAARTVRLVALATTIGLFACGAGGGSHNVTPDRTLQLNVAGDRSIGLRYGEVARLRFALTIGEISPQAGAVVAFNLSGNAMGATLSTAQATT